MTPALGPTLGGTNASGYAAMVYESGTNTLLTYDPRPSEWLVTPGATPVAWASAAATEPSFRVTAEGEVQVRRGGEWQEVATRWDSAAGVWSVALGWWVVMLAVVMGLHASWGAARRRLGTALRVSEAEASRLREENERLAGELGRKGPMR